MAEHERRTARLERIQGLRRYVLRELPNARSRGSARAKAANRAKNAILALGFALETLEDEQAYERDVKAAIQAVNGAYRWTSFQGETFEKHAAMELVADIRLAASDVLEGLTNLKDVGCPLSFVLRESDVAAKFDDEAFREAVSAWVESERALQRPGRQKGRIPDRWGPTFECLKRFQLANGITSADNLRRTFNKARPDAVPLSE